MALYSHIWPPLKKGSKTGHFGPPFWTPFWPFWHSWPDGPSTLRPGKGKWPFTAISGYPCKRGSKRGSKRGPNLTPFWTPPERTLQITPWKMRDLAQNSSKPVPEGVPKGSKMGHFGPLPGPLLSGPSKSLTGKYRIWPRRGPKGGQNGSFWTPSGTPPERTLQIICRKMRDLAQNSSKPVKKGSQNGPWEGSWDPPRPQIL